MIEILLVDAQNAAVTVTSNPITLNDRQNFSLHVKFSSATLAGSLKLQASNDAADWVDVASSTQTVTAGESHMWTATDAEYKQVRVVWTPSAGTGTLTCRGLLKDLYIKGA